MNKLDKEIQRMISAYPDLLEGVLKYWEADMHTRYVYQKCKRVAGRGEVKMTAANEMMMREKIRKEQGCVCPICGSVLDRQVRGSKAMPIDHDHANNLIRAILHPRCNTVEGSIIMMVCRALGTDWKDNDKAEEAKSILASRYAELVSL